MAMAHGRQEPCHHQHGTCKNPLHLIHGHISRSLGRDHQMSDLGALGLDTLGHHLQCRQVQARSAVSNSSFVVCQWL